MNNLKEALTRAETCSTPGKKIKSKGKGQGLAKGNGSLDEATTAKLSALLKPATKRDLEDFIISVNDFITARGSISKADFNKELADATEDL